MKQTLFTGVEQECIPIASRSCKLIKQSNKAHVPSNNSESANIKDLSEFKIQNFVFTDVKSIPIEMLFPKSIYYPNQESIDNYLYIKNAQNKNFPYKRKKNSPNFGSTFNINFNSNSTVYEICIMRNILAAIGDNFLKIYDLDKKDFISTYKIPNDKLYCVALACIYTNLIAAVGGKNSVIRIIDCIKQREIHQLIGHKNEIYDLKFWPVDNRLLLSASKDFSIRLWNTYLATQLVIFGGPLGHRAEVLSIDWHFLGEYFASASIDNTVKIWKITDKIKLSINSGMNIQNANKIKVFIKTKPIYSCCSIHNNYIDCVRFNGNFILSKSVDGIIKEWFPIFNKEEDSFYLINQYVYEVKEKIWFMKFYLDLKNNILLVGNDIGIVNIFNLGQDPTKYGSDNIYPSNLIDTKSKGAIRTIAVSHYASIYACGSNRGDIIIGEIEFI